MLSAKLTNQERKAIYRRDGFRCALCADCHAAAHGMNLRDWLDVTQETIDQAIEEYLSDLYAEQGEIWNPYRNPLTKRPNLDDPNIWCPICTNGPHGTRKCPGGTPFCAQWAP